MPPIARPLAFTRTEAVVPVLVFTPIWNCGSLRIAVHTFGEMGVVLLIEVPVGPNKPTVAAGPHKNAAIVWPPPEVGIP
jgi:hypothetical protein